MPGEHARPTSTLFRSAPASRGVLPAHGGRHSRRASFAARLRRKLLAYREIEFLSPGGRRSPATGEECLLLVHVRKVVGEIRYRICSTCAESVITSVDIEERFRAAGLGIRALCHLRSRHPGTTWRSTPRLRGTSDLLRRMRIPVATAEVPCPHFRAATS
ncbi:MULTISPECIES: hypothetical protein [unclassified Streptomyces]|uniref:hypothetical protein n=1 Tax=unclassified Streptomyces TaxID=2593676 RepID=UPI002E30D79C|nr:MULTISPECIES: hypothetical protein [unclassified Streptomyces]WUC67967.1 hypothetical protein OG861_29095 [Streptomyces sp. NBC_00539]